MLQPIPFTLRVANDKKSRAATMRVVAPGFITGNDHSPG